MIRSLITGQWKRSGPMGRVNGPRSAELRDADALAAELPVGEDLLTEVLDRRVVEELHTEEEA